MKHKKRSVEECSAAVFVASLLFCCLLCLFLPAVTVSASEEPNIEATDFFLKATPDAGPRYEKRLLFFGESTTAHLASRGVLAGGKETKQVLFDESGTKMLSPRLPYETVIDPETKASIGFTEYIMAKKPPYLVLSFGLNGCQTYASSPNQYRADYAALIRAVQSASPETKVILQTIYPVTRDCARFENPAAINAAISKLNEELPRIASSLSGVRCVDTASVLCDVDGTLDPAFDNGDGYHLTASAYRQILSYLRTHAWEEST